MVFLTNAIPTSPPINAPAAKLVTIDKPTAYPKEDSHVVPSTPVPSTPPATPVKVRTDSPRLYLPRIFVSHSSIDDAFNTRLVRDLRSTLGDSDAVWNDTAGSLQGGDHWWSKIKKELSERPIFIVVLSPNAIASKWVNDEINIAWSLKNSPEHNTHIIPILYCECYVPVDLRTLHIISFLDPRAYDSSFIHLLRTLGLPIMR